jgi:hypothetical protein
MKKLILACFVLAISFPAFAEDWDGESLDDGTYDAYVTTDSGTYTVPVEVQDGEVTDVYWPNGGDMNVYDAEIEDGSASGYNSRGDYVDIEIDE